MSRRHRTVRFQQKMHPSLPHRTSLPLIAYSHNISSRFIAAVFIKQVLFRAEQQIQLLKNVEKKCISLLSSLDWAFWNLQQLEQVSFESHQVLQCEEEPTPCGENQRPNDARPDQVRVTLKRPSCRLPKEKSQICDMSEWRKKDKPERAEHPKRHEGTRNQLISLQGSLKASESEDRSEQIQSLLRRKKQLRMESKQIQRFPSETAKNGVMDRKERCWFGQNDEGEAFELQFNQLKPSKEAPPVIQLGHVKVLSGQQVTYPSALKRRTIIELPTRKTKLRKYLGDTCVLIQQIYEQNITNQQVMIEAACRSHRGVRIQPKQKAITSILCLPTLR